MSFSDPDTWSKYFRFTMKMVKKVGGFLAESRLFRWFFVFSLSMLILLSPYYLFFQHTDKILDGNTEYLQKSRLLDSEQLFLRTADMIQVCIDTDESKNLKSYYCSEAFNNFKNDALRVKLEEDYIDSLYDKKAYEFMLVEVKHFVRGLESEKLRTSGLYKRPLELDFLFYNWFFYFYMLLSVMTSFACAYILQKMSVEKKT
ncbi:hypothetical protein AB8I26_003881 [Vibrio parahaemolyticus]|uniref:hypothetical protein n=1 Tax=Vibrio harveyi TaxID=669 RepID=UPI001263B63E|nr:hypothetical protein [Vibrio harveyi]EJL3951899.1 hypothetical protein [Vibrio parahaemolyticus]HAS6097628.1 hypothetical protein [Vibrio vulnificus]QFQ76985.1 hypothetical protein F9277_05735 [Vibrio harveyi]HDY7699562.1 hypothetical protein [Vibrio vulnificus]HDY7740768.1 hypothetical protein [Vibrio vulnificus]